MEEKRIAYLSGLNRELGREIVQKDLRLANSLITIKKQERAFKLLVDLQKVFAEARDNEDFYKSISRLICANLETLLTYIYRPDGDSKEDQF